MLRLSEDLRSVTGPDGGVILDLSRGQIFRCNRTGAMILDLLARGGEPAELVSEFGRLCNLPQDCAANEVRDFLNVLSQLGLLRGGAPRTNPE